MLTRQTVGNPSTLIQSIQESLTHDLLKPRYRKPAIGECREFGHCYLAAETLWHMLGGRRQRFTPRWARCQDGDTHWWLQCGSEILDPTAPQFTKAELRELYPRGIPCGFLTREPSKRAKILIARAQKVSRRIAGIRGEVR